jgi:hypothetical protein
VVTQIYVLMSELQRTKTLFSWSKICWKTWGCRTFSDEKALFEKAQEFGKEQGGCVQGQLHFPE